MKTIEAYVTKNKCYKNKKPLKVKKLMLHSVGCAQPSASVFVKNYNSSLISVCVHGFIDANNGDFYQTLPFDYVAWHSGGSANSTHIGIEMCEPPCIKYKGGATFICTDVEKARKYVTTAYLSAVELFAQLCKKYNLNPLTDICSHNEGRLQKIASGHVDPEHLWTQLGTGYTMNGFRNDVKAKMNNQPIVPATPTPSTTDANLTYNGVDLSPVFSPTYYADKYPDLKSAFGYNSTLLFNHFCTAGMREARQGIATFNPVAYRDKYADLSKTFGDNWIKYYAHYCACGLKEGRKGV